MRSFHAREMSSAIQVAQVFIERESYGKGKKEDRLDSSNRRRNFSTLDYACRCYDMNYLVRVGYRWSYLVLLQDFEEPNIPEKFVRNLTKARKLGAANGLRAKESADVAFRVSEALIAGYFTRARVIALTAADAETREYLLNLINSQE